jgi:hypothetical protein
LPERRIHRETARVRLALVFGALLGSMPLLASWLLDRADRRIYGTSAWALLEGGFDRLWNLPHALATVPPFSPQVAAAPSPAADPLGGALHLLLLGSAVWLAWGAFTLRHKDGALAQQHPPRHPLARAAIGLYPLVFIPIFQGVHLPFTTSTSGTFGFCPRYAVTLYPYLWTAFGVVVSKLYTHKGAAQLPTPPVSTPHARRLGRLSAVLVVGLLTGPALLDDLLLIDFSTPDMAFRFDGVALARAGLAGVDRRSLAAALRFLEADRAGRVNPEEARGVRAVLGQPFDTDYWRFLKRSPPGPSAAQVVTRMGEALSVESLSDGYALGVRKGGAMAEGKPWSGP